jgi:hypothetical protein
LFDGSTYQEKHDGKRLSNQLKNVRDLMLDGSWRTLGEIQARVGGSEAGLSARLRDLRKERFGAFQVNRRRVDDHSKGVWEYQVLDSVQPFECKWQEDGQAAFL